MLHIAKKAALAAGDVIELYFDTLDSYEKKDAAGKDLVTKADKEAEQVIKDLILTTYPNHGFWGEETGQTDMDKEYVWVVDPLDGTSNFVLHLPMYSVSIALMHNKEILLGVVYIPKTKELFWAEKGTGAFCNDTPIHVSQTSQLDQSICSVEYWSKDDTTRDAGLLDFVAFAKKTKKIRYLSSTVFELCRVAKGNLDFCLLDSFFLDIAAAKLIVEEAGGVCVQFSGKNIVPHTDKKLLRILTSNGLLQVA